MKNIAQMEIELDLQCFTTWKNNPQCKNAENVYPLRLTVNGYSKYFTYMELLKLVEAFPQEFLEEYKANLLEGEQ